MDATVVIRVSLRQARICCSNAMEVAPVQTEVSEGSLIKLFQFAHRAPVSKPGRETRQKRTLPSFDGAWLGRATVEIDVS
jgi:hypothetical protein